MKRQRYVKTALACALVVGAGGLSVSHAYAASSTGSNRESRYEKQLDKAVTDKKLSADQKTQVLAEHTKLKAELTAATKQDRKTIRKQIKSEAETWAKANNIDKKWLFLRRHFQL